MTVYEGDNWIVAKAESDDGDIIIRCRGSLPPADRRTGHSHLILIQWPYEPGSDGMPDDETDMDRLEEAVHASVSDDWGVEVASITGVGLREWRYYTPDPAIFVERFSQALAAYEPFPIQLSAFDDPEWNGLLEVLPAFAAD